jgi:benzoyl-CoA reductase/2-hydroxyglutaryl-CoA dehydratase subunit BcrC/BadD/HgdB
MPPISPDLPEARTRAGVIAAHVAAGGRIAAVLPVHYPRSLLRAFGLLPIEVWGPPGRDTQLGDAHLQAYTCSVVRSGLSFALAGGLDVASLLVIPHTCDSLQALASLLMDFMPEGMPVLPLYVPRVGGGAGTGFYAAELRAAYARLAELTGERPDDAALMAAIAREEAADAKLAALMGRQGRLPLSDRAFYQLVRTREYLPAEEFTDLAEAALALPDVDVDDGAVPILLSGMFPEPMTLLDAISDAGGRVVADDLACTGRRLYPVGRSDDPFERMAERILGSPPDSTRCSPVADRAARLKSLAASRGARGVLFFEVKFCEPELFYLPQLRAALDAVHLRSIVIEADVSEALAHQAVTRLEALLETVA